MSESVRTASKYNLNPTPEQTCQFEAVVWRCRMLYNTALEERITAYRRCGICGSTRTAYQHMAELTDLRADLPAYAAIHAHVLQDVLTMY